MFTKVSKIAVIGVVLASLALAPVVSAQTNIRVSGISNNNQKQTRLQTRFWSSIQDVIQQQGRTSLTSVSNVTSVVDGGNRNVSFVFTAKAAKGAYLRHMVVGVEYTITAPLQYPRTVREYLLLTPMDISGEQRVKYSHTFNVTVPGSVGTVTRYWADVLDTHTDDITNIDEHYTAELNYNILSSN